MADLTGRVIRGIEVRQRIGAGAFGAVYRAYQPTFGREVAVKVILPIYANQPQFIRQFEAEAQLIARLEHPFIVPLYDFWRDPDGAFLIMRLLRGGSLRTAMKTERFTLERSVRLLDQLADALSIAHRAGVIHCDLKPDNILLDEDGSAYLTDFGIAKVLAREGVPIEEDLLDEEGTISGSPGYMSPEQITLEPITARSDLYSLGIIVYELLAHEHPFPLVGTAEMFIMQLQEPLPLLPTTVVPEAVNEVLQKATDKDPMNRYADAEEFARALRRALRPELPEEITVEVPRVTFNPYKGLRPFQEADAADFFGREALVAKLAERMAEHSPLARFLAVVGPSGSGKSSVVMAGLVPALRRGAVRGSARWYIVEMVPGSDPLTELEAGLSRIASSTPANVRQRLEQGDLSGILNEILPSGTQVLLVIDQFEEIITLTADADVRTQTLNLLHTAVTAPDSHVRVIITLRADFYERLMAYAPFNDLLSARAEHIRPLTYNELESAIMRPADRANIELEPRLLLALIQDVRSEPGGLPLLQHVLSELYDAREDNTLTMRAYEVSGGVTGAVARRADEIYSGMDATQRAVTRDLFEHLVTLRVGTEDARRRATWRELVGSISEAVALQTVLDRFGKYRLLSFDRDPMTREPTIEIAHEALIRHWGQLRSWMQERRDDVRMQRSLSSAAADWDRAQRDPAFLLRDIRLHEFDDWAKRTKAKLSALEQAFLETSRGYYTGIYKQVKPGVDRSLVVVGAVIVVLVVVLVAVLVLVATQGG